MSAITAKASRKMKKYAVLTREPRCFLGSFDFSWEQRKLGELALFNPKDELPQTFEYVDLESVVGTEMLSHRTEVKSSAPSRAQRLAHTGDLFYQTVRPYQKNNYLFEKPDNNYVFSTGYAQMRPYVDGYFLLSLVQSERFVKVVLDNCTGTSYPAINANDLAEIEVAAPSDESEAQKIGTIFRSIDNLITLHQRKCVFLFGFFQAFISMIFTASTFSWEQRKWINTVDISTNMVDPKSGKYDLLPHVAPGNIESFTGRLYDNVKLVGEENLISGKFVFNVGDIVYGKINPQLGKYVFARFSGLTSADAYVLNAKNGIVQKFLYAVIQTRDFYDYSVSVSKRSGMPKINRDELNAYSYWAPSESEQLKIGEYLLTLDHLITLHQRKGKAAVTGCSNDANNSKGVCCKARDFGYKCHKKDESQ